LVSDFGSSAFTLHHNERRRALPTPLRLSRIFSAYRIRRSQMRGASHRSLKRRALKRFPASSHTGMIVALWERHGRPSKEVNRASSAGVGRRRSGPEPTRGSDRSEMRVCPERRAGNADVDLNALLIRMTHLSYGDFAEPRAQPRIDRARDWVVRLLIASWRDRCANRKASFR